MLLRVLLVLRMATLYETRIRCSQSLESKRFSTTLGNKVEVDVDILCGRRRSLDLSTGPRLDLYLYKKEVEKQTLIYSVIHDNDKKAVRWPSMIQKEETGFVQRLISVIESVICE